MPSKKAIEKALKKEKEIQALEEKMRDDQSWEEGTNKRGELRSQKINEKHENKLKKKFENKQLEEEENLNLSSILRPKTSRGRNSELDLLNETLENAPKTKDQKEKIMKIKEKEQRKFGELKRQKEKEEQKKKQEKETYLLKQKNIVQQKLIIDTNVYYDENSIYATGIDNALDVFDNNDVVLKTRAIYKNFYQRNLEELKRDFPGLRLSQYEDKIQKLWKISFENPDN